MAKSNKIANKQEHFTIGSDPELMIMEAGGDITSSIPVLKRDKHNPIELDKASATKLYADNSLAELAFAPSKNKKDFVKKYRTAFQKAQDYLGKKYRLHVKSAHFFKENELEAAHGIDPKEIGCNPEFSFWKQEMNELGAFEDTMRSGSCHIHLGHPTLKSMAAKENALKVIEIFLGCSSVIWDNDESSVIRRKKYGKSGSFRPTDYGFETRFMSNCMLNSPVLVELAYDLIEYSLGHIFNGTFQKVIDSVNVEEVQLAINTCDKVLAEKVLMQAGLPKNLFARVKKQTGINYSSADFYKNWKIKI